MSTQRYRIIWNAGTGRNLGIFETPLTNQLGVIWPDLRSHADQAEALAGVLTQVVGSVVTVIPLKAQEPQA